MRDYFTTDPMRVWESDGFRLETFETGEKMWPGEPQERIAYRLYDGGALIFEGADFGASPLHAIDSDESVSGILNFLSLQKGDTDAEYFESYTPEQIVWRDARAGDLSVASVFDDGEDYY